MADVDAPAGGALPTPTPADGAGADAETAAAVELPVPAMDGAGEEREGNGTLPSWERGPAGGGGGGGDARRAGVTGREAVGDSTRSSSFMVCHAVGVPARLPRPPSGRKNGACGSLACSPASSMTAAEKSAAAREGVNRGLGDAPRGSATATLLRGDGCGLKLRETETGEPVGSETTRGALLSAFAVVAGPRCGIGLPLRIVGAGSCAGLLSTSNAPSSWTDRLICNT